MTQHSWGATLPDRSPMVTRTSPDSPAAGVRSLRSVDVVLALVALTGGVRVVSLLSATPGTDGEYNAVARIFALGHLGSFPGVGTGTSPVAWWQFAAYTVLTRAFERQDTALAATREAMVVAALAGAALLWVLARRLDFPRWAATSVVVVTAVSPLAVGLQHTVLPENLAVVWVLAALVLLCDPDRKPLLGKDLLAAALLVVAVLTSPVALALMPAVAWLLLRRREPVRLVAISVVFELGLGLAFGPAAAILRPSLPVFGEPGLESWLRLDPVFVVVGSAAVVASLFVAKLRPVALGAALPACLLLVPGAPHAGVLAIILPLAALLVLGVVLAGLESGTQAAHRSTHGRHSTSVIVVGCLLLASGTAGWFGGYAALRLGHRAPDPLTQAGEWLQDNASGSRVLADDAGWAQLAASGWPTGALILASACTPSCPASDWVLSRAGSPSPDAQQATPEPVAAFGTGSDRVEIDAAASSDGASPTPSAATEQDARANAGAVLATSPRVKTTADNTALLRQGRVDARLLATIAALAAIEPIRIAAFPAVDGEDAAGQPRRRVVLAGSTGDDASITEFFTGQRDIFRPESVSPADGGVQVAYPPLSPTGLLTPFDTP